MELLRGEDERNTRNCDGIFLLKKYCSSVFVGGGPECVVGRVVTSALSSKDFSLVVVLCEKYFLFIYFQRTYPLLCDIIMGESEGTYCSIMFL